jgi:hypothetical protein
MKRPGTARPRALSFRTLGWLAVLAMLAGAVIPIGASAAGPGAGDSLPNSGHTSDAGGVTPTMSQNVILTCDGSTATGVSGSFTLGADTGPNTYYIVYLTPNEGSDADAALVENNEVKVDVSNKSAGDVITFSITISTAFTTTQGGILAVFAKDVNGTIYNSKSNSLNCTEASAPPSSAPPSSAPPSSAPPSGSEAPATGSPTGGVSGVTGTPAATLPATDTIGSPAQPTSDTWRLLLLVLAALISMALALTRSPRARR